MSDDAAKRTHQAAQQYLLDDEVLVGWCIVLDVIGPNHTRYLGHRAGGGADGTEPPTAWAALGMLRASAQCAEEQMRHATQDRED